MSALLYPAFLADTRVSLTLRTHGLHRRAASDKQRETLLVTAACLVQRASVCLPASDWESGLHCSHERTGRIAVVSLCCLSPCLRLEAREQLSQAHLLASLSQLRSHLIA